MENLLFFSIIVGVMINFTLGAISFSRVNRSFALMYKGLLESCVATIDETGAATTPYFEKNRIRQYVKEYLDENIKEYTTSYVAYFMYFAGDERLCLSKYCTTVRITLKADINYLFKFEKARDFKITRSVNL